MDNQPLHWSLLGNHHLLCCGPTSICVLSGWGKEEGINVLHILVGAAHVNCQLQLRSNCRETKRTWVMIANVIGDNLFG
jgi:hypothetical protein